VIFVGTVEKGKLPSAAFWCHG